MKFERFVSEKEKELIYNNILTFASARDQKTDLYFCKIPLMEINFSFINFRRKRLSDYRIFDAKCYITDSDMALKFSRKCCH